MRRSTLLSFLIAAVLAVLAVIGVRTWMDSERRAITEAALRNSAKPDTNTKVVVASNPLRFGDRITAAKLKLIDWPSDAIPNGSFSNIAAVTGQGEEDARFVLTAIEVDEPVLVSKVTSPGQKAKLSTALSPGMKAVSIRVNDVLGVAGFVLPGDRVDILLTRTNRGSDGQSYVDVLLQGVPVLAIDQLADDRSDKPAVVRTVTFEVTTAEAQKLTLAANIGTLSLALRNVGSSQTERLDRISLKDLGGAEVSESLAQEVARDDGRLEGIEAAVKTVDERIDQVEENLRRELEEAARQAREEAAPAPAPQPVGPQFNIVNVIKDGRVQEYKFRQ